jgi:hypothetical protein
MSMLLIIILILIQAEKVSLQENLILLLLQEIKILIKEIYFKKELLQVVNQVIEKI